MIQGIPRDNGQQFIGHYDTIVGKNDTDFDTMPGQGHAAGGRFRHSFELHHGRAGMIPGPPHFVVIVECHDDRKGSYRYGETFGNVTAVKEYCKKYDPTQYLPADCRSQAEIEHVRERYDRRLGKFLELIDEHVPARQ